MKIMTFILAILTTSVSLAQVNSGGGSAGTLAKIMEDGAFIVFNSNNIDDLPVIYRIEDGTLFDNEDFNDVPMSDDVKTYIDYLQHSSNTQVLSSSELMDRPGDMNRFANAKPRIFLTVEPISDDGNIIRNAIFKINKIIGISSDAEQQMLDENYYFDSKR